MNNKSNFWSGAVAFAMLFGLGLACNWGDDNQSSTETGTHLPALAAKPGYAIGRAFFEDGRPIPEFKVQVTGFDGQINLFPGSTPSLGSATGSNGVYSVLLVDTFRNEKPVAEALVTGISAKALLNYRGNDYVVYLHPTDNLPDGSSEGSFRGESKRGVARDFLMKMSGHKIGYGSETDAGGETNFKLAMYGGTISIDCAQSQGRYPSIADQTSLVNAVPAESVVELTLTPVGALLDGSPGETIVREFPVGKQYDSDWRVRYLRGIPVGEYRVSASVTTPDGATRPLRMKLQHSSTDWQDSVDILWTQFSEGLYSEVNLYLGL